MICKPQREFGAGAELEFEVCVVRQSTADAAAATGTIGTVLHGIHPHVCATTHTGHILLCIVMMYVYLYLICMCTYFCIIHVLKCDGQRASECRCTYTSMFYY